MANTSNNAAGVDNTFRRKFDREEFLERARERERQEEEGPHKSKLKGPPVQRKPLKHRDYEVDLESRLGKTQVVTPIAPLSQQAGYFCSVCECVVKDSANYLDHINGKKHQRALGMSMRVERASLQQVQERFEKLKKRKTDGTFTEQDLDERILKQQQEEEERLISLLNFVVLIYILFCSCLFYIFFLNNSSESSFLASEREGSRRGN